MPTFRISEWLREVAAVAFAILEPAGRLRLACSEVQVRLSMRAHRLGYWGDALDSGSMGFIVPEVALREQELVAIGHRIVKELRSLGVETDPEWVIRMLRKRSDRLSHLLHKNSNQTLSFLAGDGFHVAVEEIHRAARSGAQFRNITTREPS